MKKEWIGKIRIYLYLRESFYSFCWINMLKDGSLSFGFMSKTLRFTEYGSCVVRSGAFTDHTQTLTRGNMDIKNANTPHVTFHPPRIDKKSGIAHMVDDKGKVDEWELDWFPVKKPQSLLYAYTGNITALDKTFQPKGRYLIATLPPNSQCLRMELILYPNPDPQFPKVVHYPSAVANIHGGCPNYIVSCYFYDNNLVKPALYVASDLWVSKTKV